MHDDLEEADNLGSLAALAAEIVKNLAALEQFRAVAAELGAEDLQPDRTLQILDIRP